MYSTDMFCRFAACLSEANPEERKKLMDAKHFLLGDPLPSCTLQGEGNLTKEVSTILYFFFVLVVQSIGGHNQSLSRKKNLSWRFPL